MKANTTQTDAAIAALRAEGAYRTSVQRRRWFPALRFYGLTLAAVVRAGRGVSKTADLEPLLRASFDVIHAVEASGGTVEVTGLEQLAALDEPVVMVGNHVSSLETFVLPGLVLPFVELTFVLKRALLDYPWLGTTLRRLRAIAVDRQDARADLMQVLKEGPEHLSQGHSVVVFPQSTRTDAFDPEQFNSLGVKLAKRGGVRVLPFAVDTRFWGTGRWIKDVGPIRPDIPVRICFGEPIVVEGNGKDAHAAVVAFIQEKLDSWR